MEVAMFFLDASSGAVTAGERVTWTENRCRLESLRVTGVVMRGFRDGITRITDGTIEIMPFVGLTAPLEASQDEE